MEKFRLPQRFCDLGKNVWEEYSLINAEYKPLNLGMGFPNFGPPEDIINALAELATEDSIIVHQYTRGYGHPRLVTALTKLYSKLLNRNINGQMEVLVTCGAHQALFSAISGHVEVGDEAIVIEPYFDSYGPMIKIAGGVPRFIPLRVKDKTKSVISSRDWVLDTEELESLFNEKTKVIIINTPHNPLGKVFSLPELEIIANLCKKWNVLCISDEVYEWFVFESSQHVRMCSLPGMWDRTLTIGSAGKTFSVTGWRVGWIYGGANILRNAQVVHQNCVYTCTTPIQEAIAVVLEKELTKLESDDSYFITVPRELEKKRDYMVNFLRDVGMVPSVPDGGYFILADWSPLAASVDLTEEKDMYKDFQFTKLLCRHAGVLGIPSSVFYSDSNKPIGESLVRFCFVKTDQDLQTAGNLLRKWKKEFK